MILVEHKLRILGSGDASGIPQAFCDCASCTRARDEGGKHIRTRSSARVDDILHFDLSPDLFKQALDNKLVLTTLEHMFITHFHSDHFAIEQLELIQMSKYNREGKPLNVYMSAQAVEECKACGLYAYAARMVEKNILAVKPFDPVIGVKVPGYSVSAIWGNHTGSGNSGRALNYLLTADDGKKLLYGTDSGPYKQEQFDALRGHRLDVLVLECTFSDDRDDMNGGHHDLNTFPRTLKSLKDIGVIDEKTKVVMTHIGHHHLKYSHDALERTACERSCVPVTVGYDGLVVTF